jgi:hypothetical protein
MGGKRRSDYNSDLVANAGSAQRDHKYNRQDNRGGNPPQPATKKFSAADLLDQPCTYHCREGKLANHTTTECISLREIEKARRAKAGHGVDPAQERNSDLATSVVTRAPSMPSSGSTREEAPRPRGRRSRSHHRHTQVSQLV